MERRLNLAILTGGDGLPAELRAGPSAVRELAAVGVVVAVLEDADLALAVDTPGSPLVLVFRTERKTIDAERARDRELEL
jgi:hypothetical protein